MNKVAIVTGANRGLGFGTADHLAGMGYAVGMVGRSREKIEAAAERLRAKGRKIVEPFVGDVSDTKEIAELAVEVGKRFDHVDVIVNNAGAIVEKAGFKDASIELVTPEEILVALNINTVGAYRVVRALFPLLRKSTAGRIVNVSSGMAQLSDMGRGHPAYRISKTALNALTTFLDAELKDFNIKVNSVCPGWVRTDMGGPNATRSLDEGVRGIVWAATLSADGPSGGFFRDGQRLPW